MEPAGLLSDIILYPLKSAGGLSVPRAKVDRWGLEFDRRWLVVDDKGVFLTQRQLPRMALIAPSSSEFTHAVSRKSGVAALSVGQTISPDPAPEVAAASC